MDRTDARRELSTELSASEFRSVEKRRVALETAVSRSSDPDDLMRILKLQESQDQARGGGRQRPVGAGGRAGARRR